MHMPVTLKLFSSVRRLVGLSLESSSGDDDANFLDGHRSVYTAIKHVILPDIFVTWTDLSK